eukprot:1150272-Pelagomonas_calceolata.AAC.2
MKEFPKEMNARAASKIGVTGVGQMRLQILLSKILFLSMTHINSPESLDGDPECGCSQGGSCCWSSGRHSRTTPQPCPPLTSWSDPP